MAQPQPTYSFEDVLVTLTGPSGSVILGNDAGAAEEGITIEPSEETDSMHIGADGSVAHSLHASRAGRIVVRLLKTSPTNAILSQMLSFQRSSSLFHAKNVLVVTDIANGEAYTCRGVAFARVPPNTWAKEAGTIEWEFNASRIEFSGGALSA
jgi:hypothetical protein